MTKAELVEAVAKTKTVPELSKKAVQSVIDATFEEVKKSIKKEERFSFPGFGTFNKKKRSARSGRNPQTGEKIKIKGKNVVKFKPGKTLREKI